MTEADREMTPRFEAEAIWFRNDGGGILGVWPDSATSVYRGTNWQCGLCLQIVEYI